MTDTGPPDTSTNNTDSITAGHSDDPADDTVRDDGADTHIDPESGLWLPPAYRNSSGQLVFRTPRSTIQHHGDLVDDAHYGLIDESHFGDPDEMRDAQHPDLAPNSMTIKIEGEEATTLTVDTNPELRGDGGTTAQHDARPDGGHPQSDVDTPLRGMIFLVGIALTVTGSYVAQQAPGGIIIALAGVIASIGAVTVDAGWREV